MFETRLKKFVAKRSLADHYNILKKNILSEQK